MRRARDQEPTGLLQVPPARRIPLPAPNYRLLLENAASPRLFPWPHHPRIVTKADQEEMDRVARWLCEQKSGV